MKNFNKIRELFKCDLGIENVNKQGRIRYYWKIGVDWFSLFGDINNTIPDRIGYHIEDSSRYLIKIKDVFKVQKNIAVKISPTSLDRLNVHNITNFAYCTYLHKELLKAPPYPSPCGD